MVHGVTQSNDKAHTADLDSYSKDPLIRQFREK